MSVPGEGQKAKSVSRLLTQCICIEAVLTEINKIEDLSNF
jgi:hypothetical protein